ncbi:hypothetical protein B0H14DRAFT_2583061 [Mycena olivaceomarginata]|nr:hypothetical protein B0H14DRAFT_2583061 [Mycena olivaceomarginata]
MSKTDNEGNKGKDGEGPKEQQGDVEMKDEGFDLYYEGPKDHNPVVHGWIQRDIEKNHCTESLTEIRDHPDTTMLAVIITSDRTTREGGADAIFDALESRGWINSGDKTQVLTPTPADGPSANVAIHPFTNVIAHCSPDMLAGLPSTPLGPNPALPWFRMALIGLSKRTTIEEIKGAFLTRILTHARAVKLIEGKHDLIPGDDHDAEFILKVALFFTVINTCTIHPKQNSPAQIAFRIYMPPLTKDLDTNRALTDIIASRDFSFNVPGRGLATPWVGASKPMMCTECIGIDHCWEDCPILNSAGYRSAHNIADIDISGESDVATTLSLASAAASNPVNHNDTSGWQVARGGYRGGNPYRGGGRNHRGGFANRGGGYGGYNRGGRGGDRGF